MQTMKIDPEELDYKNKVWQGDPDEHRWCTVYTEVYKVGDMFVQASKAHTDDGEHGVGPWDYQEKDGDNLIVTIVRPVEKTVIVYEPIE